MKHFKFKKYIVSAQRVYMPKVSKQVDRKRHVEGKTATVSAGLVVILGKFPVFKKRVQKNPIIFDKFAKCLTFFFL